VDAVQCTTLKVFGSGIRLRYLLQSTATGSQLTTEDRN